MPAAASIVIMTRLPPLPSGAASEGSSILVRTPVNGILFGCPFVGMSNERACSDIVGRIQSRQFL